MTSLASRRAPLATIALVAVTAVWGGTFPVVKHAIRPAGPMTVLDFLVWRFALATAVMALVRPRSVIGLGRAGQWHGALLGLALGIGYVTQTVGLQTTPAGVSGFVTGMFVIFTPLVSAALLRRRVPAIAWLAVGLATAGLALLSLHPTAGDHGDVTGLLLTLVCAVMFAVHIVGLGEWSQLHDPAGLAVVQLATVTAMTAIGAAATGVGLAPPPTAAAWGAVVLTAVAGTALAFLGQTWAQSILDPTRAAVILTMEPVFAGVFAVWLAGEHAGPQTVAGAFLVLAAMFLVEFGPRRERRADDYRSEATAALPGIGIPLTPTRGSVRGRPLPRRSPDRPRRDA
jgi:drug/metabolite transporter (DMT)-like permease